MADMRTKYHSQWAGQFYAAAELTRRGYLVSFTLGNAPSTDLHVTSPRGRDFRVEVKTQRTKNFWILRGHPPDKDLLYVLVFVPPEEAPTFWVMTCADTQRLRKLYEERMTARGTYRDDLGGFNWTGPHDHEGRWDVLPP